VSDDPLPNPAPAVTESSIFDVSAQIAHEIVSPSESKRQRLLEAFIESQLSVTTDTLCPRVKWVGPVALNVLLVNLVGDLGARHSLNHTLFSETPAAATARLAVAPAPSGSSRRRNHVPESQCVRNSHQAAVGWANVPSSAAAADDSNLEQAGRMDPKFRGR
jgi:hypothetical protein